MNNELEIWQFAAEKLQRNESAILLVVAESSGSSPGRIGFKMIVSRDEMRGSIGGGVMEMRLVEQAKFKIQNSKFKTDSEIVEQVHRKNVPDSSGMICSGRQTVIFFELNKKHLKTVEKIVSALENDRAETIQISNSGFQISDISCKDRTQNYDFKFRKTDDDEFIYEEKLGFKNKLVIIGGGHCALALSELMSKTDFYISLFDDRADLNTLAKNEFVHEKNIIDSYENIGNFVESGENIYIVVMTLGYKFDEIVIRKLLDKNFKYVGVLGSRAKMKTLLKSLEKQGFDRERLNKIHTPVGLKINSRTPFEIAVSIAAEIIKLKNSA